MRVTLKPGGNLAFGVGGGQSVTLTPGVPTDIPGEVAERYAHRLIFHDEPNPPEPTVQVREETTLSKPSDGAPPPDDGVGEARKRTKRRK